MILIQFFLGELKNFLSPSHHAKLNYLYVAIVSTNYDDNQKI